MVIAIDEDDGSVLEVVFGNMKLMGESESYTVIPGYHINEIFEGDFLMIRGNGNVVRGIGCYVDGNNNECHGDNVRVCGDGNYCVGDGLWVRGNNNTIKGSECCVEGYGNSVSLLLDDSEEE